MSLVYISFSKVTSWMILLPSYTILFCRYEPSGWDTLWFYHHQLPARSAGGRFEFVGAIVSTVWFRGVGCVDMEMFRWVYVMFSMLL
jgi:hypothetical protein